MATITNSIGTTARDYSTIALWEASLPANLVTAGNSYIGECYNDAEFVVAGNVVTFGGHTTDSTHTITLRAATGQSFRDSAGVQTNALTYNVANGVGIRNSSSTGHTIDIGTNKWVTVDKLQIANDQAFAATRCINSNNSGDWATGPFISNCICINTNNNANSPAISGSGFQLLNSLIIMKGNVYGQAGIATLQAGAIIANCTIVAPSDRVSVGKGINNAGAIVYAGPLKIINTAVFGFSGGFCDGTSNVTGSGNNCTDQASATGSSNQVSKTYTSQFQGTLQASLDLRAKTGADLLNNAATDTTDIPSATDIVGTTRPQGAAWDIGCWELVTGAVAAAVTIGATLMMMGVG